MADKNNVNNNEYFEERAGTEETCFHVVPHEGEGWAVKKEGQDEPEPTHESKSEAVEEVKRLAEEAETMVNIHSDERQIEEQENYKK